MQQTALQCEIVAFVENFVAEYSEEPFWRKPLVGFSDPYDPYIQNLPKLITEKHMLPQDFMAHPTAVISVFVPFLPEIANSNIGVEGNFASDLWDKAYHVTNTMLGKLADSLAAFIESKGCHAVVPTGITMFRDILMSNWSQRHFAYAAGMGTFGINNMLITESGCCGRYVSVIADLPDPVTTSHLTEENCLYKKNGSCKVCINNCFSGALTLESFNRQICLDMCNRRDADCCGKCDTGIPCAFGVPDKA